MRAVSHLFTFIMCITAIATTAGEWFFSPTVSKDWETAIPESAFPFAMPEQGGIDLDSLLGRKCEVGSEGVVYWRFSSGRPQMLDFGIACDWWFQAAFNGKPCLDTLDTGNGHVGVDFSPNDNTVRLPVQEGGNLLAVRVIRGSESWRFVVGAPDAKWMPRHAVPDRLSARHAPMPDAGRSGGSYQVILLGDTHYDTSPEVYHRDYNEPNAQLNRIQRSEFARNEQIWRDCGPRMMRAAAAQVSDATALVVQVGDLVQGDCGNPTVHERMMGDALALFKGYFGKLPFLATVGNHDVRGPGAEAACRRAVTAWSSRELQRPVGKTTFHFRKDGDLWLFIDFNRPDLEAILQAFDSFPEARYKFIVTHGPVLPSDSASARWFLFGDFSDNLRRRFRELFLQNDVIVLTGHEHRLELQEVATPSGRITQLMANCVWGEGSTAAPQTEAEGPEQYGGWIRRHGGDAKLTRLLDEYHPALTRYWRAKGAGFYVLDISDSGVNARFFGGDAQKPCREIRLR